MVEKLMLFKDKTDDLDNFTCGQSNKISLIYNLVKMLYKNIYIDVYSQNNIR
jgi:hypothetical protein